MKLWVGFVERMQAMKRPVTVDGSEIRRENHLGCTNPVNIGINYLSAGAGFLPSTV